MSDIEIDNMSIDLASTWFLGERAMAMAITNTDDYSADEDLVAARCAYASSVVNDIFKLERNSNDK